MSWSIEEHIGEGRPWPAQVVVYRGETSECLAYVSGEVADRLKAENAKLLKELEAEHALAETLGHCHEMMQAENAKLRELCGELAGELHAFGVDFNRIGWCGLRDELRELGVEVD